MNGRETSNIIQDGVFIKADTAECQSENQVCCKKDNPPPTKTADDETCESHKGILNFSLLYIQKFNGRPLNWST